MKSVFINFSNHPSCNWEPAQTSTALQYGMIVDIPFPSVSPEKDKQEIEKLADDCVCRIMEVAGGTKAIVHIMGEMTLTYAVVTRLKAKGISCVASTSERIVKMKTNSQRVSEFRFVRFREY